MRALAFFLTIPSWLLVFYGLCTTILLAALGASVLERRAYRRSGSSKKPEAEVTGLIITLFSFVAAATLWLSSGWLFFQWFMLARGTLEYVPHTLLLTGVKLHELPGLIQLSGERCLNNIKADINCVLPLSTISATAGVFFFAWGCIDLVVRLVRSALCKRSVR